jgi:hypothetical protein
MRPRPQPPRGQYPDAEARRNAFRAYEQDKNAWFEELLADPRVQRIIDIPNKGPIFILDARDIEAPTAIDFWLQISQRTVSVEKFGRAAKDYQEMLEWQKNNPDKVKIPD